MSRNYVCYLVDTKTGNKIVKYNDISDCQIEKHKRNKKEKDKRYVCQGGWVLNKLQ